MTGLAGLRFLVVLADGIDGAPIRSVLPRTAPVRMTALRDAMGRIPQMLDEATPDLVLIACSSHSEPMLALIREIRSRREGSPIVVLSEVNPNGFMAATFDAGVDDIITLPQPVQDVAFALEKVIARRQGAAPAAQSPMVAVLGPKGGTGKTLTSCNLAVALALEGQRPVIVDLDLQFGDVGLALGLKPERTIHDLAVAGGELDAEKVESFLMRHADGVRALLAPVRPDEAASISISFLRATFEILRASYDFVIVDTPPAFSPEMIAAVDSASHLCLVGMLDVLSLKDTKIGIETLARMGYDPRELTVVLNRADTSVGIGKDDVEHLLGTAPDVLVPSDRAVPRALTAGETIVESAPKSGPARAFMALANLYLHEIRAARTASEAATTAPARPAGPRFGLKRR